MRKSLPWIVVAVAAIAIGFLFNDWAPLQFLSMAVYTGVVIALAGAICVVFPFRFLGVTRRRTGLLVSLAGIVLTLLALFWPSPLARVKQHSTHLDDVMPSYHFQERHVTHVHAPAPQVMAAIERTTLAELSASVTLMRIRGAVLAQSEQESDKLAATTILNALHSPPARFVPLDRDEHEIVMGTAGRPWTNTPAVKINTPADFKDFQQPDAIKVALNLRVDDAGNGWSTLTTETRVLGLGDPGRRTMARYWRLIVPGSGIIRRQWLNAIRKRAEDASAAPGA